MERYNDSSHKNGTIEYIVHILDLPKEERGGSVALRLIRRTVKEGESVSAMLVSDETNEQSRGEFAERAAPRVDCFG